MLQSGFEAITVAKIFRGVKGFITGIDFSGSITISAMATMPRTERITSKSESAADYEVLSKQLKLLKRKTVETDKILIVSELSVNFSYILWIVLINCFQNESSMVQVTNLSDSGLFGVEIILRGDSFENQYYVENISKSLPIETLYCT
jgi:hypothetical protein